MFFVRSATRRACLGLKFAGLVLRPQLGEDAKGMFCAVAIVPSRLLALLGPLWLQQIELPGAANLPVGADGAEAVRMHGREAAHLPRHHRAVGVPPQDVVGAVMVEV